MKKCIISRDVTFREQEMGNLVENQKNTQLELEKPAGTEDVPIEVETSDDKKSNDFGEATDWDQGTDDQQEEDSDLSDYHLARDRARRTTRAPTRYGFADFMGYALSVAEDLDEPKSYSEVMRSKEKDKWMMAMEEEINSLYKNQSWKLVNRPRNQKL